MDLAADHSPLGRSNKDVLAGFENVGGSATGADRLWSADGANRLRGHGGEDSLYGLDGNDTLYGGDERDYVYSGDGVDSLFGGEGSSFLYGGLAMTSFLAMLTMISFIGVMAMIPFSPALGGAGIISTVEPEETRFMAATKAGIGFMEGYGMIATMGVTDLSQRACTGKPLMLWWANMRL